MSRCDQCGLTIDDAASDCAYCGAVTGTTPQSGAAPSGGDSLPTSDELIRAAHESATGDTTATGAIEPEPTPAEDDPLRAYRPEIPVEPRLPEPEPPKPGWWEHTWVRIAAGVIIFGAISLWNSGVFDPPPEEEFLDGFGSELQASGLSEASWECIEQGLRSGGYVAEIAETVETWDQAAFDDYGAFGGALTDLPPSAAHFMEGYFHFALDPRDGCLSPQELTALGLSAAASGDPMTLGSDPTLDSLHERCEAGSMADCDMMWLVSPLESEYEAAAFVCGGRTGPDDFSTSSCMYYHDDFSGVEALESQCHDGFFPACDWLGAVVPVSSDSADVALTCGGRRDPNSTTLCWLAFGMGTRE